MGSYDKLTIGEKIGICENVLEAERNGISRYKSARNLGVSDASLYRWLKAYEEGTLTGESEESVSSLDNLIEAVKEDGNGLVEPPWTKPKRLRIIIDFGENDGLCVEIDDPELPGFDEQRAEIRRRVFSKCRIFTEL